MHNWLQTAGVPWEPDAEPAYVICVYAGTHTWKAVVEVPSEGEPGRPGYTYVGYSRNSLAEAVANALGAYHDTAFNGTTRGHV
jgi:hypothetical protein